jgi:hypothetical protein
MTMKIPAVRRHVSAATLAVLAAGAALSAAFIQGGSFAETFDNNLLPATLETTGAAPSITGGAVVHNTDFDRGYTRSVGNFDTTGFVAEVTVTVAAGFEGAGMGFFGFGAGERNFDFFDEPATSPAIYARIGPDDFGPFVAVTNGDPGNGGTENIGNASDAGDGTHRLRITWNPATQAFTFAIHQHYAGGPFVPTTTIGPVTVTDTFSPTDSRIFFGGAGNATFDNLWVLTIAGTPGQSSCLGVSRNALAREFGGLAHAASSLGFDTTAALQSALNAYCGS